VVLQEVAARRIDPNMAFIYNEIYGYIRLHGAALHCTIFQVKHAPEHAPALQAAQLIRSPDF
jgi:hypothetical protein